MTCQSPSTLYPIAGLPAQPLTDERPVAVGGPAAEPRVGFWRWLSRPRLPRLDLDDLSEHRQRDLGLRDGRWTPRDGRRD